MTDRNWRQNTGHLKANILGGPGADALRQTPNLPVITFHLNGAAYEVHSVEGRLEIMQSVIEEVKAYIGRVEYVNGVYLALYDRSVRNLFPLTNSFTVQSQAVDWLIKQADDRLAEGYRALVKDLKGLTDEN